MSHQNFSTSLRYRPIPKHSAARLNACVSAEVKALGSSDQASPVPEFLPTPGTSMSQMSATLPLITVLLFSVTGMLSMVRCW